MSKLQLALSRALDALMLPTEPEGAMRWADNPLWLEEKRQQLAELLVAFPEVAAFDQPKS